jgi:hypothetical protein
MEIGERPVCPRFFPDSLHEEYVGKAGPTHSQLADINDGLRVFEIIDKSVTSLWLSSNDGVSG